MTGEPEAVKSAVPVQEAPTIQPVEVLPTNENIQAANDIIMEKQDPFTAGIPEPVKVAGPAKVEAPVYGEKKDALEQSKEIQKKSEEKVDAPVAAPQQQIAPVSANGDQTSARSAPQADAPANVQESSQVAGPENPSADTSANPSNEPATSNSEAETPVEAEETEDSNDPLVQANKLLQTIPGRLRLY